MKKDLFIKNYKYDNIQFNKRLTSTMNVGGNVFAICSPINEIQIIDCIRACKIANLPYYVCGNLSNTIIKDTGYDGVIIKIYDNFSGCIQDKNIFTVKGGTSIIKFSKTVTSMGYGGLEFAGGIPGSVAGCVFMNAGAYDGQMSDVVKSVKYCDEDGIKILELEQLEFGYRQSVFEKMQGIVILEVKFELNENSGNMDKLNEFNQSRKDKQPLDKPNCGSTFKRPVNSYASKLVDECGLKGMRVGGAMVSTKHCGFIVNENNATSIDVLTLVEKVRQEVFKQKGIMLETEWIILD